MWWLFLYKSRFFSKGEILWCFNNWKIKIGSQDSSGWKGPQQVSGPTSCSQQGQLWGQNRLLQGLMQSGVENLQGRRLHNLSGRAICATAWCPHVDKIILVSSVNFSWLCLLSLIFLQYTTVQSMALSSRQSCRHWQAPPKPSLL